MSWENSTIGEVSQLVKTGKTPPSKEAKYFKDEINWYNPGDFNNGKLLAYSKRRISACALDDNKAVEYPENSLLITCIGDIGKVGISREKCSSNQQITAILPKKQIDVDFLYYWVVANKRTFENVANSAVVPILNNKGLRCLKFSYPPLSEQKRIAAILDEADRLRQKDKQLIEKYNELSQSVFLELFGDPFNNQNNFEKGTIRDLVSEVKYGTSSKAEEDGEYPYLRMNNITYSGHMDFAKMKYINLTEKDKPKYLVQKGDLLFNRTNSKELVGKTAVYNLDKPMAIAGYLIRVRANEKANTIYISGYLNSVHGKMILNNMCKSIVGMANINAQELQDIKILVPPISLQSKFVTIITEIEQQKAQAEKSLAKSEDLFNSLLQRAFKGEL
ncbi:restriction endonuclease subunit S [Ancylomarina sp. 16SWW S1-10-2]|uniref:restriction endonuclease subunit S n=1 Tax=Ancylomarina sp. 16SWW S1-10-2 TaxID=2499681 RepID=UPI0012AE4BEE|nr:restriction endonuclease subunit S [Ancylomarina sp. 16SWW S1-10-2]MRT92391.1 restriction endonuclease subunit S [Ancylomarina sp. 16SWW S1-10-2]